MRFVNEDRLRVLDICKTCNFPCHRAICDTISLIELECPGSPIGNLEKERSNRRRNSELFEPEKPGPSKRDREHRRTTRREPNRTPIYVGAPYTLHHGFAGLDDSDFSRGAEQTRICLRGIKRDASRIPTFDKERS